MSDLYLHEESDYPDKNASGNEDFWSKILQPFQFQPVQKIKMCGNESHEKENKDIHTSAVDLLHVRIGNFALLVTRVGLIYLVDEFFFLFLV